MLISGGSTDVKILNFSAFQCKFNRCLKISTISNDVVKKCHYSKSGANGFNFTNIIKIVVNLKNMAITAQIFKFEQKVQVQLKDCKLKKLK